MRFLTRRLLKLCFLCLVAALVFVAGVLAAPLLRPAPPVVSLLQAPAPARTEQDLALVSEAWRIIEREYYGKSLQRSQLIAGAVLGMITALEDAHSAYQTRDEVSASQREIDGSLQSLGMAIEKRDDQLVVVAPLRSSPAQRAGIQCGDQIVRIDGRDTALLTLGQAANLMRGPAGSNVSLSVVRQGTDVVTLDVQRGSLIAPLFSSQILSDGVLYVNISFFDGSVARDLSALLQTLQDSAPRGIILDLRNNPGGYLEIAIETAGQFIAEGVIVSQQGRAGTYTWSYQNAGKLIVMDGPGARRSSPVRHAALAVTTPMIVLVSRGTASAAEVLAAALQDHGRAAIMGEQTYGKGVVTGDYLLSDGSSIHLTNGQWLSPKGRSVDGIGLTPDLPVFDAPGDPEAMVQQATARLLRQP